MRETRLSLTPRTKSLSGTGGSQTPLKREWLPNSPPITRMIFGQWLLWFISVSDESPGEKTKTKKPTGTNFVVLLEGSPAASVKQEFWRALGGESKVADEKTGGEDVAAENEARAMFKLMRFDLFFLFFFFRSSSDFNPSFNPHTKKGAPKEG